MAVEFDTSDIDRITEEFAAKAERLELLIGAEETKQKVKKILKPITEDAKARIHSIDGGLAHGVECMVEVRDDYPTYIEVGINYKRHKESRHAHLVEGGHGGPRPARPHPFWEPAVEAHYEEAVESLEDTIVDLINDALG